jgi:hypothetical protein
VTLTTRDAHGVTRLVREFTDVFVRKLAWASGAPVPWFYAVEGAALGHPHLHALVHIRAALTTADVAAAWGLGFTRVLRYDSARGAAYYLTKELTMHPDGYDISRRLPPRRARAASAA